MILYGMTARNFKERFDMTDEEAQTFVNDFKGGLPVLFNWVAGMEKRGENYGFVTTMFGRPRRVKSYFDTGDWSWANFGRRTCVNAAVQGTGADILKFVLINLFRTFYNNKSYNGIPLTKFVRFKNTIHDEINYQIIKKESLFRDVTKKIMQIMRVKLPNWSFPMEVGLSIGNRWGQSVDFTFNSETLEILGPKKDEISDKDICRELGIKMKKEVEPEPNTVEEFDPNLFIEY